MTLGGRAALVLLASAVMVSLLAVLSLRLMGDDMRILWRDIAVPVLVLVACLAVLGVLGACCTISRLRNRRRRAMARYQLVLSQADEASFEEVAAACEQLVQTLRESLTKRITTGQPWLAIESWFVPPSQVGETGTAALMLMCPPCARDAALAALRRAYPDLTLRLDEAGEPLEFNSPSFEPAHVVRVRKARSWALPLAAGEGRHDNSNARSTMAGIIRQQQQAGRLSCVRWCILPAADHLDSRAAERLGRITDGGRPSAARADDVRQAIAVAGGAMCFLELQAAVDRRASGRQESFRELQNVCRRLLSPALSHRGPNHLSERAMIFRQRLYCQRWVRGEPPLLPDLTGSTLVSPRELALLMELPSLASEHALPLQRNTVPHLPIPTEVPRAALIELPSA